MAKPEVGVPCSELLTKLLAVNVVVEGVYRGRLNSLLFPPVILTTSGAELSPYTGKDPFRNAVYGYKLFKFKYLFL